MDATAAEQKIPIDPKPRTQKKRSLRFQIFLVSTIGTVVAAAAATIVFSVLFSHQIREGMEMKARALANLLAANLVSALDFDDAQSAQDMLSGLEKDEDLAYVLVLRKDGSTFVELSQKNATHIEKKSAVEIATFFEMKGYLNIAAPVLLQDGGKVGTVQLGFSTNRMREAQMLFYVIGVVIAVLMSVLLASFILLLLHRTVFLPMRQVATTVKRIGEGDLRPGLEDSGRSKVSEFAVMYAALEQARASIFANASRIRLASLRLAESATDIANSTANLSHLANEQASAIFETSKTVEHMKFSGKNASTNAIEILETAKETVSISGDGLESVGYSVDQMKLIREQVEALANAIDDMHVQIGEVGEIIASVNDIAEQSNVLAINASIEAASAGEHGHGFSVVAKEVKVLADQSKQATIQVRSTLEKIRKGIEMAVNSARTGREGADAGVKSIETTGGVIETLAKAIRKTARSAESIAENTKREFSGLEQISAAMEQINGAAAATVERVRDVERSGDKLSQTAGELEDMVSTYILE